MFAVAVVLQEKMKEKMKQGKGAVQEVGRDWPYLALGPKQWPSFNLIPLKYKEWAPFTPDPTSWMPLEPQPALQPPTGSPKITHYDSCEYM